MVVSDLMGVAQGLANGCSFGVIKEMPFAHYREFQPP
jgi:hypothetical protein